MSRQPEQTEGGEIIGPIVIRYDSFPPRFPNGTVLHAYDQDGNHVGTATVRWHEPDNTNPPLWSRGIDYNHYGQEGDQ